MKGAEVDEVEPAWEEQAPNDRLGLLVAVGLVVAAGWAWGMSVALMIVGLLLMIFLHELGHFLTAKSAGMKVTEFFLGFGPRVWSFRRGETEYGLKAIPAGAYVRIIGMSNLDPIEPGDEGRTYLSKPYWRRMSVAVAGSAMHFTLALLIAFIVLVGVGLPNPDSGKWTIDRVFGPARAAGVRPGDRIVSVDGHTGTFDEVSGYVRRHPGARVDVVVERDGIRRTVQADLARYNPSSGERVGYLGIGPHYPSERLNPLRGGAQSVKATGRAMKDSVVSIGKLFSPGGLSNYYDTVRSGGKTADGKTADRPTSVVGLARAAGDQGMGVVDILQLMFFVNVFVGIFNLTPMLPFDGGHVVIATYEKIRSMRSGRDYHADVAKLMPFTYAIVMALALLFLSTIYLDLFHWQSPG
jgi:membrane-associated protease RseP (regulator of RpoE activity)